VDDRGIWGSISGLHNIYAGSGITLQWLPEALSPRIIREGREATTYSHLVPRSIMVELYLHFLLHVTCTPIAMQRVGKQIPAKTLLVNSPLLGYATIEEAVFSVSAVTSQQWIVITLHVFSIDPTDAPLNWLDNGHVIYVYYRSMSVPRLYKSSSYKLRIMAAETHEQGELELGVQKSTRGLPMRI
jgi:hypothetical protein